MKLNVLFVCSKNRWRSPTAERIFQNDQRLSVRSCGLSSTAKRRLTEKDLHWADIVFVMESNHRSRIVKQYRDVNDQIPICVLDIPDEYQFLDPELIELLELRVGEQLEKFLGETGK